MRKFKVSNSEIVFRIDINFEDCEVDVVYSEKIKNGVQTPINPALTAYKSPINSKNTPYTPTYDSVDFCLHWLAGFVDEQEMCTTRYESRKSELEKIGLEVRDWNGLMMGCCHINCSCSIDDFSIKLVKKANKIVQDVFDKYCIYYK